MKNSMIDIETIKKLKERRYPFKNSDGKWGYTDIFGKVVVPAQFDEIEESRYHVKSARELDCKPYISLRELINTYTDYPLGENKEIKDESFFWECVYNRKREPENENQYLGPLDDEHNIFRRELGPDDFAMFGWVRYGIEDKNTGQFRYCEHDDIFPTSEGLIRVAEYQTFIGVSPFTSKYFSIEFIEKCLDEDFKKITKETLTDCLKWGFINNMGEEIIPFDYNDASDFHEGLAAVCLADNWGYIDKKGNTVIPFAFDWADSFEDGYARVLFAGLYYIIDKEGFCYESFEELETGNGSKFYL